MHKKSPTVVCKQPYGIYGYVNVRCLLEARTVLQGPVGNTVRYKRAMPVGSPYGIARRSPDRLGWKYRTVLDKGRKGKSIPYGSKRGRDFKLEARTGWHAGSPYGIAKQSWHNVGGGRLEMVRLWSLVRAQAVVGGHGVEADGEQPPPLVGESGILSRTVCCKKWSPYGLNNVEQKYRTGLRIQKQKRTNKQTNNRTVYTLQPYGIRIYIKRRNYPVRLEV